MSMTIEQLARAIERLSDQAGLTPEQIDAALFIVQSRRNQTAMHHQAKRRWTQITGRAWGHLELL